jgi:hypothetical protein
MDNYLISFTDWIKTKTGKNYLLVSGIFSSLYSVIPIAKTLGYDLTPLFSSLNVTKENLVVVNYSIQIIFILYVVLFAAIKLVEFDNSKETNDSEIEIWRHLRLHKKKEDAPKNDLEKKELWHKFKKDVNKVARQFASFWICCWICWLAFYILMTINKFHPLLYANSILNLANNINALMFIFLFMTLSVSTAKFGIWYWTKFAIVIFIIFLIDTGLTEKSNNYDFVFALISGLFASLAMASFVGSINSRVITIPLRVLLPLTLYAAVQTLYVFFVSDSIFSDKLEIKTVIENTQTVILLFAFILKILLFLLVTWILQTGRLVHFIIQEGALNYQREDNFAILVEHSKLKEVKLIEQEDD